MDKRRSESATGFPLNDERVAALLDGRLAGAERDAVLAQLAADPEWRQVLIDAAIVIDDVSSGRETGGTNLGVADAAVTRAAARQVLPIARGAVPASASMTRRLIPLAALAAAAAIGFLVLNGRDRPESVPQITDGIDAGAAYTVALAPEALAALQRDRWSVQRAASDSVSAIGRAVRLGVWAVDAGLDRAGGGQEAREAMVALLAPVPGAGAATAMLRATKDSASSAQAFAAVRALVDPEAFDVGVALELVRSGSSRDVRGAGNQLRSISRRTEFTREVADAAVLLGQADHEDSANIQRAVARALNIVAR